MLYNAKFKGYAVRSSSEAGRSLGSNLREVTSSSWGPYVSRCCRFPYAISLRFNKQGILFFFLVLPHQQADRRDRSLSCQSPLLVYPKSSPPRTALVQSPKQKKSHSWCLLALSEWYVYFVGVAGLSGLGLINCDLYFWFDPFVLWWIKCFCSHLVFDLITFGRPRSLASLHKLLTSFL